MRAWIDVATLIKPKSKRGRSVARAAAGLPCVLREGMEVAFVPPQTDMPRRGVVQRVDAIDDDKVEVTFDTVGEDESRNLVGCHCLVRRDALNDDDFEDAPALWHGFKVIDDELGEVGTVEDVVEYPAQLLLQVRRADNDELLLVPAVDEIVRSVDFDTETVSVNLPSGIMEL